MKKSDTVAIIILSILFITAYVPIWEWMYERFVATDTYYSHGFLIPPISAFLIWRKRDNLKEAISNIKQGKPYLLILGLVMILFASLWRFYFLGGLSVLVMLYATTEYLFGQKLRKLFFFPILFLFFMVPIPETWIAVINLKLKFLATSLAVKFVDTLGFVVVQDGSKVFIADGVMTIGDVCSGLRSLISLLAFGTLFSYMTNLPLWKKYILFLAAFPCAIASNVVRIIALCFVAEGFGVQTATGKFHDYSGLGVFVVAFCILFALEKLLSGKKLQGIKYENQ